MTRGDDGTRDAAPATRSIWQRLPTVVLIALAAATAGAMLAALR